MSAGLESFYENRVEDAEALRLVQEGLAAGEDFATLATRFSTGATAVRGGDIGWVDPKEMVGPLRGAIEPLEGRAVLDVGSGNGYYALRMRDAGARAVIGVDPTLLFVLQFLAVRHFDRDGRVFVLPFRLEELPAAPRAFDTTFSMGVLYHQRSPLDHLRQLRGTLRPGGQLVLETIFVPGEESYACTPEDRYARMRNVWLLPTIAELTTWLKRTGFRDINIVDQSLTTTAEQRSTEWMSFESLAEAHELGLLERLPVTRPVPSSEFPQIAERPLNSVLDTTAVRETFDIEPAGLQTSLRTCLEQLVLND